LKGFKDISFKNPVFLYLMDQDLERIQNSGLKGKIFLKEFFLSVLFVGINDILGHLNGQCHKIVHRRFCHEWATVHSLIFTSYPSA